MTVSVDRRCEIDNPILRVSSTDRSPRNADASTLRHLLYTVVVIGVCLLAQVRSRAKDGDDCGSWSVAARLSRYQL